MTGQTYREVFEKSLGDWVALRNGHFVLQELFEKWDQAYEFVFRRWLGDHALAWWKCGQHFHPRVGDIGPEDLVLCDPCAGRGAGRL